MDGTVLSHDSRRGRAFAGRGALLIELGARADLALVRERLSAVLRAYADAPEFFVRWRQLWNTEVGLDFTLARPALERNVALLAASLTADQARFVWSVVERVEELAWDSLPILGGETWHCIEIGLIPNAPGRADGRITLSVGGFTVIEIVELVFPAESILGEPLVSFLEAGAVFDTYAEVTWIDTLQFDRQPIGCASY
jgi:hypothetical protein